MIKIFSPPQHTTRTLRYGLGSYLEVNECLVGSFADFSRSFDCVQLNLLPLNLSKYDINAITLTKEGG